MEETVRKVSAIFDKMASVKITPTSNYSVPEYWMNRAIKGDEKCKDNLFNWISLSLNIDKSILNAVFNAKYNKTNENKIMNRNLIRLTENDLHRIVKESVNRILREDKRHAWELTDDGIDEFDMDSGYPTPETSARYSAKDYRIGDKMEKARNMGLDQASGRDFLQSVHLDPNRKFKQDDPRFRAARDYVNYGKYFPLGYSGGKYFDDNAEDDLKAFNKSEHNKQAAADRRWMKAADSRPLYRKNGSNNDIPR